MKITLDPTVLDAARDALNVKSDEKLAAHIGVSASSVYHWRCGARCPKVPVLIQLQNITGRPYGTMLIMSEEYTKAA